MRQSTAFLLIFLCGGWLGGFVYYTAFGYVPRAHRLAWRAEWIDADASASQVYARKTFYLSRPVRHAWLQVMAPDTFSLYVNGRLVATESNTSYYAAGIFDLTPLLTAGKNVIALRAARATYPGEPKVIAEGAWEDWSGHRGEIRTDGSWRVASCEERQRSLAWWYDKPFDESGWQRARARGRPTPAEQGKVRALPALFQRPLSARWIWARDSDTAALSFHHNFSLPARPREVWLGVATGQAFTLLVNGVIAARGDALATPAPESFGMTFYDVTPLVRKGSNAVQVTTRGEAWQRGLLVEGVALLPSGELKCFYSDERWEVAEIPPLRRRRGLLQPVTILAAMPAYARDVLQRNVGSARLPGVSLWKLRAPAMAFMLFGGLLLLSLSWGWSKIVTRHRPRDAQPLLSFDALCHGTVLLLLAFVFLLRYDVRLDPTFPFQWRFIGIAFGALIAAKLLTNLPTFQRANLPTSQPPNLPTFNPYLRWSLLILLILIGFALRLRDVRRNALVPDEITQALQSLGVLERGYPSLAMSDALGERPVLASTLVAYLQAASFALLGRDELAARLPSVLFGTLMILLIYRVGREMFDERVGLFAAFLYTFSPWAIVFAQLARYPQQLQLLTLLAVWNLFRALQGERVSARAAALFALSVLACYFTWEASVLMLLPLFCAALYLRGRRWEWLKEPATWASVSVVVLVILIYRLRRMMINPFIYVIGTNVGQVSLGLTVPQPGFDLFAYVENFLLLEGQLVLSAVALGGWLLTWRQRNITFLFIVLVGQLLVKTLLLPLAAVRYAYEVLPFLLLLASGALFGVKDTYFNIAPLERHGVHSLLLRSARTLMGISALTVVALTSMAFPLKLYHLPGAHPASQVRLGVYRDPNYQQASAFLRRHAQPQDVIVATHPQAAQFYYGRCDYFPETSLQLSLLYSPQLQRPVHRIVGCPVIYTLDDLKAVFARNSHVWFLVKEDRFEALCDETFVNYFLRVTRCVYEHRGAKVYLWER
ncbi:MAG: glycosyltransferase family 39 protein [Abditibacteriales bacterium]|nr:glycosyltransferase family 39 protein [Abditibacteriales bacterium]MDW8365788.1 glycosyltransferase family 39 protein [Abditibacteriales bacterium]